MAPPYNIAVTKSAKDQLAKLYLQYRRLRLVADADFKIENALTQNPQGGHPIPKTNRWTITVHPLRTTYEIIGAVVKVLRYDDSISP